MQEIHTPQPFSVTALLYNEPHCEKNIPVLQASYCLRHKLVCFEAEV